MYYTNRYGVTEIPRQGLIFGALDTAKSFSLTGYNGLIHELDVQIPDFTNAVTATVTLTRSNGVDVYTSEALAKNADHVIMMDRAIVGTEALTVTLSGAPGGEGGQIDVTPILV